MSDYSLQNYAQMISDPVRMPAYLSALKSLITPETVVLDLGAGTGVMTLMACKYGAKHVYAVEPNPAIQIAMELVSENGYGDRVSFFNQGIETVEIDQQVDLIVSDLRGKLPLYSNHLKIIKFTKDKFLKANGVLLPSLDRIKIALCKDAKLYQTSIEPWFAHKLDLNTKSFSQKLSNYFYPTPIKTEMLASNIDTWSEVNYNNIVDYSYAASVTLSTTSKTVHGFLLWFESQLTENISYECGPEALNKVYGSVFFPFEQPVQVDNGTDLKIDLSANYIDSDYVWRWKTSLVSNDNTKILFDQSNFLGLAFTKASLEQLRQV